MDVAALNLAVKFDQVQRATAALKEQTRAASASERAAQRWGLATKEAGRSSDDFSKRVQRTIRDLEFERQQLTRSAAAKERYAVLRRAGVSESSAEGRAILASVVALQAQRSANENAAKGSSVHAVTTRAAGVASRQLLGVLGPLAAALSAAAVASYAWSAGMKAADYGEQAEQIGVSTDLLQAYRFAGAQAGIQTEQMDTAITKLAKTMGAAAGGSKEQIELFERLGVKLLDAQGELRPVAEILPEVARGVLNIGSSSQRTATLMELFGRSGAKMTTVLEEIAQGNDTVVAKARAAGVILDTEVIAAWDRVSDSLTKAKLAADTTFAKLGAPIATSALEAIEKLLKSINEVMDQINSKDGFWASVLAESRSKGRIGTGPNALRLETPEEKRARLIAEKQKELGTPAAVGRESMIQNEIDQLARGDLIARQAGMESDDESARRGRLPAMGPASGGVRNPLAKGGGSDPYAKAIESAQEYVLSKRAETEAVGQTVLAAARLKHEQDLLNKATSEGRTLSEAQKAALQGLAGQMAEADSALAKAKFTDDARVKSEEFLAQQQLERDSLFLSAQAAEALRLSTEMLNAAKRQGIELSPSEVEAIKASADAMAESAEQTRKAKELVDFGRETFKGFFSDVSQGLRDGATIWEAFGKAAENALNRIADKLIEMAANQLFEAAFGGSGGSSSGGLGGLLSGLFGGSGGGGGIMNLFGGGGGAGSLVGSGFTFANGAAFRAGNVIPFASGGVVGSPSYFPMSGGHTGLMGEAGPEAIMPLHRTSDGGLGVRMNGGGGTPQPVIVHVYANEDFVRAEAEGAAVRVVSQAAPTIENRAVKRANDQAPAAVDRATAQGGGIGGLPVTEILAWPTALLKPESIEPNVAAFTRSGGRTLGGLERVTRTDRGFWSIVYKGVPLDTPQQRRLWNAVAEHCGGAAGLLKVPVWSFDSAAWPAGTVNGRVLTAHSDGSSFGDGSLYAQSPIGVTLVNAAAIGATSVTLRIGHGIEELAGVRFSYQGALYRTGVPTLIDGSDWTVPVSPAIRAPIAAGADLEFGLPTCVVRLASDREMDVNFSRGGVDRRDVAFVEAADYWNDLAAG